MPEQGLSRGTGIALIVLTLLSWSSVPLFLRDFAGFGLDPFASNGWRYLLSAAFWLPLLLVLHRRGQMPAGILRAAAVPVAFNIAGQTAFAWGPTLLEPGFFSFVFRVQIIFVTLGAYLLFPGERALLRTPGYWVGVALVVGGSVGLLLFSAHEPSIGGGGAHVGVTGEAFWRGVGVSLLAGVLFAGYGLSVRYYVGKFHPVVSFGVICQFTAVGMVVLMLLLAKGHGSGVLEMTTGQWGKLVASAFVGIAISHVMYYASLKHLGVAVSVGVIQLQPIITAIGSTLIFNERLTALQWSSGVVGVAGAIVMLRAGARLKKTQAVAAEAEGT
ncbi:MAG: DMT family transporter [bacterium]